MSKTKYLICFVYSLILSGCLGSMEGKVLLNTAERVSHSNSLAPREDGSGRVSDPNTGSLWIIVPKTNIPWENQSVIFLTTEQFVLCRSGDDCLKRKDFTIRKDSQSVQKIGPVMTTPINLIDPMKVVVHFAFGKSDLETEALNILDPLVDQLSCVDPAAIRIVIAGYTDDTGPMDINTRLAQQRAVTVAGYFREKRIQSKELVSGGRPLCCYVAPNTTPEGQAENRRVEIWVEPVETRENESSR